MKRSITFIIFATICVLTAISSPADPGMVTVPQPDGGIVTLRLIGDEYFHYTTTGDGYTVVLNRNGAYEYAILDGDLLKPSGILAHDAEARSDSELKLLSTIGRHIHSAREKKAGQARRVQAMEQRHNAPSIDYDAFKGLVVLINFTDKKFSMESPNEFYSQMLNQRGYAGFEFGGRFQACPGSACDYFSDNSGGIFEPQFDVIGPVEVDYSSLDGNAKSREIFENVLQQIDSEVDFTQYDADGNGEYDWRAGDYPYYDFNNDLCPRTLKAQWGREYTSHVSVTAETEAGIVTGGLLSDQVLKGDQTIWWVFNDMGNVHTESKGQPIGMEIRAQAFAFSTMEQ